LGAWTIHHGKIETRLDRVEVQAGETLDFVVDCLKNEGNDDFTWPPVVTLATTAGGKTNEQQFSAAADFRSSLHVSKGLTKLEQYAQALLLANEFVFVD
jgi:hypothetical protein